MNLMFDFKDEKIDISETWIGINLMFSYKDEYIEDKKENYSGIKSICILKMRTVENLGLEHFPFYMESPSSVKRHSLLYMKEETCSKPQRTCGISGKQLLTLKWHF